MLGVPSAAAWAAGAGLTPQGPKLTGAAASQFGASTALSAAGTTALVGSSSGGPVVVMTRTDGIWTPDTTLTPSDAVGAADFGAAVALSADGTVALVGGPADAGDAGAAWVFTRAGSVWTQAGKLTAPGEIGSGRLGASVALSGDGAVAVVGAPSDNGSTGAVWVYTRSGDTWSPLGPQLVPSDETGSGQFGSAVAVSADGTTIAGGAPDDSASTGAAWVFAPGTDGTFAPIGTKITASTTGLGTSLALDATGATLLAGAPAEAGGTGAGYVFTRSGAYADPVALTATFAGSPALGASAALSSDGSVAILGGPGGPADTGAAWSFTRSGATWTEQAELDPTGSVGAARAGSTVALAADGHSALVGGPGDDASAGAVWPFADITVPGAPGSPAAVAGDGTVTVSFTAPTDDGGAPVQGYEIAVSPGTTTVQTTGTQATIGSLTNGTTYTFTIRARNTIGRGATATASATPQPGPQVSAVSPRLGPAVGGTVVSITGSHFTGATGVSFGGAAATQVIVVSDTQITATAPPHAAAAVDVIVQGPVAAPSPSCADAFAYVPTDGLPLPAHGCAVAFPLHTAGPGGGAPQVVRLSVPVGGSATLLDAVGNDATVVTTTAGRFELNGGVVTYSPAKAYHGPGSVSYRLRGDGGSTSTSTYSTDIAVPPPPVAPPLTSIGDPGVTQQKAIGIVAGETLVLLDPAARPAAAIVVSGEGRYELGGGPTLLFQPAAAFRGKAHGIHYRLTDEYGQQAIGTYTPTVTGTGGGSGGSGGSGSGGSTSAPSVRLTTATLNVATAAGVVPIGCGLSSGLIADCRVALVATVSGHQVVIGTGVNSPDTAVADVVVRIALTARGRELSRRLGGIAVRAVGSIAVAGLPGHVTGTVALHTVAQSFLLPHSVRFAAQSAKLSASERRYLTSLTRSLRGVHRIDCIGAARDVRTGSRRTSLARSRARTVCAYLKGRLPRTTVFAPRAERTGDRRGTTRHADLLVRY